jgi:hypothetical protein
MVLAGKVRGAFAVSATDTWRADDVRRCPAENSGSQRQISQAAPNRRTREILEGQRQRFREKFGRDWGDNDPVFFDPEADSPTEISPLKMEADVLDAMRRAGTPPQIQYAYKRTGGLILTEEMREHWPPDRVQEWDAAIEEYFAIEKAKAEGNLPDPSEWMTEIPELLVSGFTKQDLDTVHEIMTAIAPIEARPPGLKVVQRIELAAVFLASACDLAYDSANATGAPGAGPDLYAKTEEIVVRRARESYGQGRA